MKNENNFDREPEKAEAFRLLSEFYHLPREETVSKLRTLESLMVKACADAVPYVVKMGEVFKDDGDIESLNVDGGMLS